jgi:hypothetical protein
MSLMNNMTVKIPPSIVCTALFFRANTLALPQRRQLSTPFSSLASATRSSLGQCDEFVDGAPGCNILGLAGSRQCVEALAFLGLFLAAAMLDRIGQGYRDVEGASGCTGWRLGTLLFRAPARRRTSEQAW